MNIKTLMSYASEINSKSESCARIAFEVISEWLTTPYIDLESSEVKKVMRRVAKIGGRYALQLIDALQVETDEAIDSRIRQAVLDSNIAGKEFYEVQGFYKKVKPMFFDYFNLKKGDSLDCYIDFCSGNGLNGLYWLAQGAAKRVIFVDPNYNYKFLELRDKLNLDASAMCCCGSIYGAMDSILSAETKAITAIHACGSLTENLIDSAKTLDIPFAVMPCCYEFRKGEIIGAEVLEHFSAKSECMDIARIIDLTNSGWTPYVREIPKNITEMNRIIIGLK